MKFYNLDLVFAQRETTSSPYYQLILFKRLNDDSGIEITFDLYVSILKKFVKQIYDHISNSISEYPEQVVSALTRFLSIEEPIIKDVNDLTSFLIYWNYEILVVGRIDANDGPKEVSDDYEARSYLINNHENNPVGLPSFYTGYSIVYESELFYPYSMDYLDIFGLTYEQLEEYQLLISQKTYNLLRSQDNLKIFDDSECKAFIESRGYRFLVCNKLNE